MEEILKPQGFKELTPVAGVTFNFPSDQQYNKNRGYASVFIILDNGIMYL